MNSIDDNTKFYLLKIPNLDCIMFSYLVQEIALTENSSTAFEKVFEKHREGEIVLFVTIQGSDQIQGVCKVN